MNLPQLPSFFEGISEQFIRENLLSDDFFDFMNANRLPLDTMMNYYECAIMEIETKFRVLDSQFSLQYDRNPIESIKTRVKSYESIMKKIRRKKTAFNLEAIQRDINDIAGVRVVCSFIDDIYFLADCLLKQDDIRLIERRDYIKEPKESGYRSLHLIVEVPIFLENEKRPVKVEVQLRTIAMDFWASLEHKLHYKKSNLGDDAERLRAELIECADMSAELDLRMQDIRNRIYNP
ncbi:MAG: GTP pyrophosphokinase family protein [Lachnospiraceae bacterium]|nr:GTP pyrophosphokinase family protein [Lachnospiraceae bacterium]